MNKRKLASVLAISLGLLTIAVIDTVASPVLKNASAILEQEFNESDDTSQQPLAATANNDTQSLQRRKRSCGGDILRNAAAGATVAAVPGAIYGAKFGAGVGTILAPGAGTIGLGAVYAVIGGAATGVVGAITGAFTGAVTGCT